MTTYDTETARRIAEKLRLCNPDGARSFSRAVLALGLQEVDKRAMERECREEAKADAR